MHVAQGGDPRAFELLYDRHGGAAFSLAYRMVGTRAIAEDIVQEAFLSLWRNLVHERRRASAEGIEERLGSGELTDVEAARREEAREVRAALQALPGEQSRVIELAYYGGVTPTHKAE